MLDGMVEFTDQLVLEISDVEGNKSHRLVKNSESRDKPRAIIVNFSRYDFCKNEFIIVKKLKSLTQKSALKK